MKYIFLLAIICMIGCNVSEQDTQENTVQHTRIDHVTKVFFENTWNMIAVCENPETKKITFVNVCGNIEIFADVSPDEPMWIDIEEGYRKKFILHLRSTQDLNPKSSIVNGNRHENKTVPLQELP